jgi:hypothetical protein
LEYRAEESTDGTATVRTAVTISHPVTFDAAWLIRGFLIAGPVAARRSLGPPGQ